MNLLKYTWKHHIEICEHRDPKGLYKKAREGAIKNVTGIDSEYEKPELAEITINTANLSIENCAALIFEI